MEAVVSSRKYTASEIASALGGNGKSSNGWYNCSCPCSHNHAHGDKNPSCAFRDGEDGNLIPKCQTGCNPKDIFDALRARGIGFFERPFERKQQRQATPKPAKLKVVADKRKPETKRGSLLAEYLYRSEDGELIVTKKRYEKLDKVSGELIDLKRFEITPRGMSDRYVLYNAPYLKIARESDLTVYLCEGEKDADTLSSYDMISTCNIEGASLGEVKWRDSYTLSLVGLNVVILADNDEAGRLQARGVAARLHGKASSVKVVDFPELPEKGDVTDYLASHSKEQLLAKIEATPIYSPPALIKRFEFTDMGNAHRLAHYHRDSLAYCDKWDSYMSFNGRIWAKGEVAAIKKAQETVGLIPKEAELIGLEDHQEAVTKHYISSQRASAIKGMLYQGRPMVQQVEPESFDASPDLFNVANGTIDLRTGTLKPHDKADLITKWSRIAYDPNATAPRWKQFLSEIYESPELIRYIQLAIGYSLTGHSNERAFFILHGAGQNGKSTFVEAVSHVFGPDYSIGLPSESLYSKKTEGGVPNDIARLRGSRFVYSSEGEDGKHLAVAKIKQLTGNEKITSRHMKGEWFDFMSNFKIWFSTNHKPEITESAQAIWDRVKLIPFNRRFTEEEKDPHLKITLIQEAAGILNWGLEGARLWYQQGLGECSIVKAATSDYKQDSDLVGQFLGDVVESAGGAELQVKTLYQRFDRWMKDMGHSPVMSSKAFSRSLKERGLRNEQRGDGNYYWQGIRLRENEDNLLEARYGLV